MPSQDRSDLAGAFAVPRFGVGLQFTPGIMGWFPFFRQKLDALEVLLDNVMAPADGPGLFFPGMRDLCARAAASFPLVGHSNYGGDYGFGALASTVVARRHVPIAKALGVPWVSNHCFYCDDSWADVWPSPVQFSRKEIVRVSERAKAIQALYGVPLAHENAAYFRPTPGSVIPEEEFLTEIVERAGTGLHLDLHNLYSNERNHAEAGFSIDRFLRTIPLDRVVVIHMAGGRWLDGMYLDSHDTAVPEDVWGLLDHVLTRTRPGAVILEYESDSLREGSRVVGAARSVEIVEADLERARNAWDRAYGPHQRRTTSEAATVATR